MANGKRAPGFRDEGNKDFLGKCCLNQDLKDKRKSAICTAREKHGSTDGSKCKGPEASTVSFVAPTEKACKPLIRPALSVGALGERRFSQERAFSWGCSSSSPAQRGGEAFLGY